MHGTASMREHSARLRTSAKLCEGPLSHPMSRLRLLWIPVLAGVVVVYLGAYFSLVQKEFGHFRSTVWIWVWWPGSSGPSPASMTFPPSGFRYSPRYGARLGVDSTKSTHATLEWIFWPAHWLDYSFARSNDWSLSTSAKCPPTMPWWSVSFAP
jgi:hypothetical protein